MTPETVPVAFTVQRVELVRGCGRLLAVAVVALDVAGVELVLQGVRVMREADGIPAVRGPAWRHPGTGQWHSCLLLPPELSRAIGDDVLAAFTAGGG